MQAVKDRVGRIRRKSPLIDHAVRTVEHYLAVHGSIQAGAVTYFAFLSFFPLLALGFAVIGYVARVYPDAQANLVDAINEILPGMVGEEEGQISLATLQAAAPAIFSVGVLVMLYSGLGWLSAMRDALLVVFEKPRRDQPNFVVGKLRDLAAMVSLGLVLLGSVAISGVVTALSERILDLVGLGSGLTWLLNLLAILVGLLANAVLFFAFFKLLGDPEDPPGSLWSGALLGAAGFEVLKQASRLLLRSTAEQPAFQAFGIALILVVWINYFSRVVILAAAWAHVGRGGRRRPGAIPASPTPATVAASIPASVTRAATEPARRAPRLAPGSYAAGAVSMLALVAVLTRRRKKT